KNVEAVFRDLIRRHAESTFRLAIHYQLNPFEWSLDKDRLSPELREEIESSMARLPPPPPAPKTLGELLGPLGGDTPLPLKIPESPAEAAARKERLERLGQQVLSKQGKKDEED